jgi:hypothetical protein
MTYYGGHGDDTGTLSLPVIDPSWQNDRSTQDRYRLGRELARDFQDLTFSSLPPPDGDHTDMSMSMDVGKDANATSTKRMHVPTRAAPTGPPGTMLYQTPTIDSRLMRDHFVDFTMAADDLRDTTDANTYEIGRGKPEVAGAGGVSFDDRNADLFTTGLTNSKGNESKKRTGRKLDDKAPRGRCRPPSAEKKRRHQLLIGLWDHRFSEARRSLRHWTSASQRPLLGAEGRAYRPAVLRHHRKSWTMCRTRGVVHRGRPVSPAHRRRIHAILRRMHWKILETRVTEDGFQTQDSNALPVLRRAGVMTISPKTCPRPWDEPGRGPLPVRFQNRSSQRRTSSGSWVSMATPDDQPPDHSERAKPSWSVRAVCTTA